MQNIFWVRGLSTKLYNPSALKTDVDVHPIFQFWSLLATKLQKYYVIFVYILQSKMGKTEKNWERKSRN